VSLSADQLHYKNRDTVTLPDGLTVLSAQNMPVLSTAAAFYRSTINRLAIETRTRNDPRYDAGIGWRITRDDWERTAADALLLLGQAQSGSMHDKQLAHRLIAIADPYNRPELPADSIQRWRDHDFALMPETSSTRSADNSAADLSLLPLLEFYNGLIDIDRSVARMYDAQRYDLLMKICLVIGGILLLATLGIAVASGFKDFDWSKVPLEGSLGIVCGFGIGLLLDSRRRSKTRTMVERWGQKFGCDLKQLAHKRLPQFVTRLKTELTRLDGQRFVDMDPDTLNSEVTQMMEASGYRPIGTDQQNT
jgi:hypothetical protein